jgi:hypothetical protein
VTWLTRALLAAALTLVVGCLPPAGTTSPRRTVVFGASITAQVVATPVEDGDGRTWRARNGATIHYWADAIVDEMHAGAASIVVADPIYNSLIKDGGWTADDEAVLSWIIMAAQPDDCVVIEDPWVQATAELTWPGILENVNRARAFLDRVGARTFDWRPVIETDPTLIAADGLHLAAWGTEVTPVVQARYDYTETGARMCRR